MKLIKLLAIVAVFAGFTGVLHYGLIKSETQECLTWQVQSQEFSHFFLAEWQATQCNALGIVIDAPIAYAK